jgi:RHS repeat-associated protein
VKTDSPGTPVSVPYKYTGKEKDTSTGLYYYEARYYDPTLARFISADTIVPNPRDPQDLNRYTYAGNNPFKYTDPTGHFSFNIGKMFRRAFGDVGTALVGVAIQATGPFGMTMNAVLGSAVLTQSKTGRYVLAGEILVGTAVLSWECGGCGAYATGAAIGAWTGAAMGGYSAAQNGGDLSSGILFGSAIGAATGAAAGGLGSLGGGFGGEVMTNAQLLELGAFVSGKLAAGAIAGAGQGATTAYAGGRGNIGMIAQGALQGGLDGVKSSAIGVVGETSRFHTALTGAVKSNLYPGGRLAEVIGQTILNTTGLYSDLGTVGSLALDLQGGGLVDYVSGYVSGRVATADYRGEMALNNRMNRKFENEHSGAD